MTKLTRNKTTMKSGFTLIEILVVITIIALLAVGGLASFQGITRASRDGRRKTDIEQIRAAIELYRNNNDNGSYPDSSDITVSCASTTGITDTDNTYLARVPLDPQCTAITYSYQPTDSAGGACDSADSADPCLDYTISAYLENSSATACTSSAECGQNCNYCLGPNGQK